MRKMTWRRMALGASAPVGALIVAAVICSAILLISQHNPFTAFGAMGKAFGQAQIIVAAVNQTGSYYLAAVAVAIGFKMNLLNIGVDGQYRLAAMLSAAVAGAAWMTHLPGFLRVIITLVAAMVIGASWAGVAVWLKVTRGVSEVISTIMLNAIATGVIAYLLTPKRLGVLTGNSIGTATISNSGMVPTIGVANSLTPLYTLTLLAVVVGVLYALLLSRTVFGFSIKATGLNPFAAIASGISAKKMAVSAMLISGAIAGLVGMPELLNGPAQNYSINFPSGLGLTGIAIALLGRNHPVGMAFAALLWSALDGSSNALQNVGVANQLVAIMQGTIVLSVVIAYELVRRYRLVLEQKAVAGALAGTPQQKVAA
jgi:ABC-type uncharacterized transport system permease subunit